MFCDYFVLSSRKVTASFEMARFRFLVSTPEQNIEQGMDDDVTRCDHAYVRYQRQSV